LTPPKPENHTKAPLAPRADMGKYRDRYNQLFSK
jgi:hypothetical protein